MDFELEQILLQRLVEKELEATQENLDAELIIYNEELAAQVEAARIQEIVDRDNAISAYDQATFDHVEKVVLDYTDMTSQEINDQRISLEHQEAAAIEVIRVNSLNERFDTLYNLRFCMIAAGINIPNEKKFKFLIIRDNDVTKLEQLEAVNASVENVSIKANAKETRQKNGKLVRDICDNILNSIIGFNMEGGKTSEEINSMSLTFADILSLLKNFQPFQAKPLIQAIEVDLVVTQEMKDEILECYL